MLKLLHRVAEIHTESFVDGTSGLSSGESVTKIIDRRPSSANHSKCSRSNDRSHSPRDPLPNQRRRSSSPGHKSHCTELRNEIMSLGSCMANTESTLEHIMARLPLPVPNSTPTSEKSVVVEYDDTDVLSTRASHSCATDNDHSDDGMLRGSSIIQSPACWPGSSNTLFLPSISCV